MTALARLFSTRRRGVWAALSILGFLIAWQILGASVDPMFFSTPSAIIAAVPRVMQRGLIDLYAGTMGLYLVSVAVAIVAGIVMGLAMGMLPAFYHFVRPIVAAMYSTPTIVLIPILVVWFGDGAIPVFVLVFIASFFPMVFSVQLGVAEVGADMKELGRSFGATSREILVKIIVPSMLPYVFSGLKVTIPRGFIAVLAAEMLISAHGLGGLVLYYGDAFQTDRYFVPVVLIAATAYLISEGLHWLEASLVPWKNADDQN